MPELPEVETVRKGLNQWIQGKTIAEIKVFEPRIVENYEERNLNYTLQGQTIYEITRRGKYLFFNTNHHVLVSHLRMEGKYYYRPSLEPNSIVPYSIEGGAPHVHLAIRFQDDSVLFYHDTRKFGRFHLYTKEDFLKAPQIIKLGYEPFDELPPNYLYNKLHRRTISLKQALLNQEILLGLGNIYVDETCFEAKLHPLTPVSKLTKKDCDKIVSSSKHVLNQALLAGGTTIRTFHGSHYADGLFTNVLFVYGRQGSPCVTCGTLIQKIKVHGRGTHFCPQCQRRK